MAISLREFFFPSEFRPRRAEYAPPKKPFKKKKEEFELPLLEPLPDLPLYLPRRIAEQVQADIKRALGFYYTGREQYRQQYLNAGISPALIPEEELEELPGAEGIRIPILGWSAPSKQVRNIARNWWESVVTWSDVSLTLEQDFVWKPILRDWGIEGLSLDAKNQVLDAAGNVLSITEAVKKEYPLAGAILDWTKYGGVRGDRRKRFGTVKEEWLKQIQPQLSKDELATGYTRAALWQRIEAALTEADDDRKKKLVSGLWRDFEGWFREGYTFGISESYRKVFKIVEFRGLQFEAFDFLDLWEKERLFRGYIWTGFLRPQTERRISLYLQKHPKVHNFLYKALSPILSPELTKDLLDSGQILPNRLIRAFIKRVFKEKGPGPKYYLTWKRWFLPGRFVEWVGRHLTKIQQTVVGWVERQIIRFRGTSVGRILSPLAAGRGTFVQQALGRFKGLAKSAPVLAVRKQVARAALSLWRRGYRTLAKWLVRSIQGLTKLTGPVGAVVTTVGTFVVSKFVGRIWEASKKTVAVVILSSCACLSGLVMAPFILLVIVIGTAFQPGEMATGGPGAQLVEINKTATPNRVDLVPATADDPIVDYEIRFTNETDGELTDVILEDDYDQDNFTPFARGGATIDPVNGTLSWNIGTVGPAAGGSVGYNGFVNANDGVDKVVVNSVNLTAVTADDDPVSVETLAFVIVGNPTGQYPTGWPTAAGCISQGPEGSDSHTGDEAIDIAPVDPKDPTSADLDVLATHDGIAYVGYDSIYGHNVTVISPLGFYSFYGHLASVLGVTDNEQVFPGHPLGSVHRGIMGKSSGTHLHYELVGLRMAPPYIPQNVKRGCVGRDDCNFCYW